MNVTANAEVQPCGTSSTQKSPKSKDSTVKEDKDKDGGSSPSGRSSPDANCPICLGKLENESFTDSCLHQFCFTCLLEWSKVKAECPLCKQSFKSIIHNVRSIEDYEQYYLSTTTEQGIAVVGELGFPGWETSLGRTPFRYRTTAVSSYLDYVVRLGEAMNNHVIPSAPPTLSARTHFHRRRQSGTSDFRRNIYQQGLWVQQMADVTGRVRECSPEFFRSNPAQVHRLVPWLNRELNVLCGGSERLTQRVITHICELITQFPVRSPAFAQAVHPYVGRHTDHFTHEFYSFAISPYDMVGYDRFAQYVSRSALAHLAIDQPVTEDDGNDSDVQVVDAIDASVPRPRVTLLSSDTEDEVVVVDNVIPRQRSPEVITLDSDDECVQVNINIRASLEPQPGPSRTCATTRRVPLKRRCWHDKGTIAVVSPTRRRRTDSYHIAININHPSPQRSPSISSFSSSSSSVSWNPRMENATKKKNKKACPPKKRYKIKDLKQKKCPKAKPLDLRVENPKPRPSPKYNSGSESGSPIDLRKHPKLQQLKSSESESDHSVLHIDTDQFEFESSSSDPEYKPRLKSVVIKSEVKQEQPVPQDPAFSPKPTSHWLCDKHNDEATNSNMADTPEWSDSYSRRGCSYSVTPPEWSDSHSRPGCSYSASTPDFSDSRRNNPERRYSSNCTSSSSERRTKNKKCKHSKKRLKKDKY